MKSFFEELSQGRIKLGHLAAIGGVIICFLAFTYITVEATGTNSFCGTVCHEMDDHYTSWQASAHRNVDCAECHEGEGVVGLAETKMEGMRELWLHITGGYEMPIVMKNPDKINCYSCHQDKMKADTDVASLRQDPHTMAHFENNMTCMSCHAGVVHNNAVNTVLPSRDTCFTCHLDGVGGLATVSVPKVTGM